MKYVWRSNAVCNSVQLGNRNRMRGDTNFIKHNYFTAARSVTKKTQTFAVKRWRHGYLETTLADLGWLNQHHQIVKCCLSPYCRDLLCWVGVSQCTDTLVTAQHHNRKVELKQLWVENVTSAFLCSLSIHDWLIGTATNGGNWVGMLNRSSLLRYFELHCMLEWVPL